MSLTFVEQILEAAKDINDLYVFVNEKEGDFYQSKRLCKRARCFGLRDPPIEDLQKRVDTKKLHQKTSMFYLNYLNKKNAQDYGVIIGIDLGTTYTSVGIFKDGQAEILANDQGNRMTPSYVAFTPDGKRLIGDDAKNQLISNPENTVFDVKRLIGREFSDPSQRCRMGSIGSGPQWVG